MDDNPSNCCRLWVAYLGVPAQKEILPLHQSSSRVQNGLETLAPVTAMVYLMFEPLEVPKHAPPVSDIGNVVCYNCTNTVASSQTADPVRWRIRVNNLGLARPVDIMILKQGI